MRKILILLFAALFAGTSMTAQSPQKGPSKFGKTIVKKDKTNNGGAQKTAAGEGIIDNGRVDVPATYPGGDAALLKFISSNLVYPSIAIEAGTEGVVVLNFIVKEDGSINSVKVLKSLSEECDQAAIDAVKKLKRFTPAKHKGRPVAVNLTLPVRFRIAGGAPSNAKNSDSPTAGQDKAGNDNRGVSIDDPADNAESGNAQNNAPEEEILDNALVEQQAAYPGGDVALLEFISRNLVYPSVAIENELQGVVVVRFVVKKDGSIGQIKIQKSLSKECDQAATNVIKKLERFTPAKDQGRPISIWYTLPVRFRLQ